jgi:hypothetical protein
MSWGKPFGIILAIIVWVMDAYQLVKNLQTNAFWFTGFDLLLVSGVLIILWRWQTSFHPEPISSFQTIQKEKQPAPSATNEDFYSQPASYTSPAELFPPATPLSTTHTGPSPFPLALLAILVAAISEIIVGCIGSVAAIALITCPGDIAYDNSEAYGYIMGFGLIVMIVAASILSFGFTYISAKVRESMGETNRIFTSAVVPAASISLVITTGTFIYFLLNRSFFCWLPNS